MKKVREFHDLEELKVRREFPRELIGGLDWFYFFDRK